MTIQSHNTLLKGLLKWNEPLARHTSWHVGGLAKRWYKPADLNDLTFFLSTLPVDEYIVWLGLGSNVLIHDEGISGTVIATLNGLSKMTLEANGELRIEAGVPCAKVAKQCVKEGFAKGAFFAGIPGTVGGALAMNAGAFGDETWTYVTAVETINRQGIIHKRTPDAFKVSYREVHRPLDEWFVAGYFRFPQGEATQTEADIKALLKKRNDTQPIGTFNCGSVFRNPPNDYAARLIESCGLKGFCIGDAEVSTKHANFIINRGKATAQDIEQLIAHVQTVVHQKTGVHLMRECHFMGAF